MKSVANVSKKPPFLSSPEEMRREANVSLSGNSKAQVVQGTEVPRKVSKTTDNVSRPFSDEKDPWGFLKHVWETKKS